MKTLLAIASVALLAGCAANDPGKPKAEICGSFDTKNCYSVPNPFGPSTAYKMGNRQCGDRDFFDWAGIFGGWRPEKNGYPAGAVVYENKSGKCPGEKDYSL